MSKNMLSPGEIFEEEITWRQGSSGIFQAYIETYQMRSREAHIPGTSHRGNGVSWEGAGDIPDHGNEGRGRGSSERSRQRRSGCLGRGAQSSMADGGHARSWRCRRLPSRARRPRSWPGKGREGEREAVGRLAGALRRKPPTTSGGATNSLSPRSCRRRASLTRGRRSLDLDSYCDMIKSHIAIIRNVVTFSYDCEIISNHYHPMPFRLHHRHIIIR